MANQNHKRKRIQKTAIYKLCRQIGELPKTTLKDRLDLALETLKTVGDRRLNIASEDSPCFHIIHTPQNKSKNKSSFIFGTLLTYTPGKDPLFIVDDPDALEISLGQYSANLENHELRREFLDSLIYFCIKGNHIVLIQSQHLKVDHLFKYIDWLLRSAKALSPAEAIRFSDTPPPSEEARLKKAKGVRSISFSNSSYRQSTERLGSSLDLFPSTAGEDKNLFSRIFGEDGSSKLNFDQINDSQLKMSVSFEINKDTTDGGQTLIDELGAILQLTDDLNPILELKEGGTIQGSMLKLTKNIRLTSYNGQLDTSETYEELKSWLSGVLSQKTMQ